MPKSQPPRRRQQQAASKPRAARPGRDGWQRLTRSWGLIARHQPGDALLLLWPVWWALWLAADGFPPWHLLLIFTLGAGAVHAAVVIIGRSRGWPTFASGHGPPPAGVDRFGRPVWVVLVVLMAVAVALVLATNRMTLYLGLAGLLLAAGTPIVRRHSYLVQVYLGVVVSCGIPMAFAAVLDAFPPPLAWLLFLANVLWASGYNTWRAMAARADDIRVGTKSTAVLLGDADRVAQAILHVGFFWALLLVGQRAELGGAYLAGLGVALAMVGWDFWLTRQREPAACLRAFRHSRWQGAVIFVGLVAGLWLKAGG